MEHVRKVLVYKSRNRYVQFFRYGLVSVVALVVDFGGLVLLHELAHFHYLVAATISFIAGLLTNYFLSRIWAFHSSKLSSKRHEFIIFTVIGIIGLVLTNLLLWVFTDWVGLYYVVSKVIATVVVYFWNFGARKKLIFN